jgi:hypothetical protein
METLKEVAEFVATHALALGVGVSVGLVVENIAEPFKRLRGVAARGLGKASSMLGLAKDAVEDKEDEE